jgi:hypothetical protein
VNDLTTASHLRGPAAVIAALVGWLVLGSLVVILAIGAIDLRHHGLGPRSSTSSVTQVPRGTP